MNFSGHLAAIVLSAFVVVGARPAIGLGAEDDGGRRADVTIAHARQGHDHEWRRGFRTERRDRQSRREHRLRRMVRELDLTDEQADKIREVMTEARKSRIKARAGLQVARIELRELLRQDQVDPTKLEAKIGEIGGYRETLLRQRVDARLRIREILTPEQRQKARSLSRERWREGRDRFRR